MSMPPPLCERHLANKRERWSSSPGCFSSRGPHQIRTRRFPPSGSSAVTSRGSGPECDPDARPGQTITSLDGDEALPAYASALTSSTEPLPPRPPCMKDQAMEASGVTRNAEVVHVPVEPARERCVLILDREMPVAPTPLVDEPDSSSEARASSLERHAPQSGETSSPEDREAEEIDAAWTFPA